MNPQVAVAGDNIEIGVSVQELGAGPDDGNRNEAAREAPDRFPGLSAAPEQQDRFLEIHEPLEPQDGERNESHS